jgi:hypothetical protein
MLLELFETMYTMYGIAIGDLIENNYLQTVLLHTCRLPPASVLDVRGVGDYEEVHVHPGRPREGSHPSNIIR